MSGKVVMSRAMSLDGFIAGPDDAMDWIFDFLVPAPEATYLSGDIGEAVATALDAAGGKNLDPRR